MKKRTTIELDEELLRRAKRALGSTTTRETVEEALRRASDEAEREQSRRRDRQVAYLAEIDRHIDPEVLESERMWH